MVVIFFFQAEDGIRDLTVTGVQTCALPISLIPIARAKRAWVRPTKRLRAAMSSPDSNRPLDRKSTRLNSSHSQISYAVFCLKKKKEERFYSYRLLRATKTRFGSTNAVRMIQ